jgi:hypothetical protein
VRSRIASIKISDVDSGDVVTMELDSSQAGLQGYLFKKGEDYFEIIRHEEDNATGTVILKKTLMGNFEVSYICKRLTDNQSLNNERDCFSQNETPQCDYPGEGDCIKTELSRITFFTQTLVDYILANPDLCRMDYERT